VGRGDGFVLTIAEKIGASILSNDSYQEFHEQYPWLFNAGRLIGGKPVPNVGWVFIERLPVRPSATKSVKKASREANRPMPIPKAPPPAAKLPAAKPQAPAAKPQAAKTVAPKLSAKSKAATINELTPFLEFVEKYPVGSKVKGVVDQYSAHGVYVKIGDVRGYLPLRLMATPAPRSAREHVKIGQFCGIAQKHRRRHCGHRYTNEDASQKGHCTNQHAYQSQEEKETPTATAGASTCANS
jgi:hypothetical protein